MVQQMQLCSCVKRCLCIRMVTVKEKKWMGVSEAGKGTGGMGEQHLCCKYAQGMIGQKNSGGSC